MYKTLLVCSGITLLAIIDDNSQLPTISNLYLLSGTAEVSIVIAYDRWCAISVLPVQLDYSQLIVTTPPEHRPLQLEPLDVQIIYNKPYTSRDHNKSESRYINIPFLVPAKLASVTAFIIPFDPKTPFRNLALDRLNFETTSLG